MFNLLKQAFDQSKPFLSDSYSAIKSGGTAGLYAARAGVDVLITTAYTTKAAVKTTYYGLKHLIFVGSAAYGYYTAKTPEADAPEADSEDNFDTAYAQFNLERCTDTYNEACDNAQQDFSETFHTFTDEVTSPVCDAAHSVGQAAYYTVDSLGHGLKAAGNGLLLVGDAAKYCLSSASLRNEAADEGDPLEDNYEFIASHQNPVFGNVNKEDFSDFQEQAEQGAKAS